MKLVALLICAGAVLFLLAVALGGPVDPEATPAERIRAACERQWSPGSSFEQRCELQLMARSIDAQIADRDQAAADAAGVR